MGSEGAARESCLLCFALPSSAPSSSLELMANSAHLLPPLRTRLCSIIAVLILAPKRRIIRANFTIKIDYSSGRPKWRQGPTGWTRSNRLLAAPSTSGRRKIRRGSGRLWAFWTTNSPCVGVSNGLALSYMAKSELEPHLEWDRAELSRVGSDRIESEPTTCCCGLWPARGGLQSRLIELFSALGTAPTAAIISRQQVANSSRALAFAPPLPPITAPSAGQQAAG